MTKRYKLLIINKLHIIKKSSRLQPRRLFTCILQSEIADSEIPLSQSSLKLEAIVIKNCYVVVKGIVAVLTKIGSDCYEAEDCVCRITIGRSPH